VEVLRKHFPELKVRVIHIVDLMKLQPQSEHPHGLSDKDFDVLFTRDKPIMHRRTRPGPARNTELGMEQPEMSTQSLMDTARAMVADHKGLVAVDMP
jgi:hypothetical protein